MATYMEYQKKELGWGINPFNRPVEYSGVTAWVRLITQLLFIRPGTYPTDPKLGIGLQDYRFAIFDDIKQKLEDSINFQVRTYLPDLPMSKLTVDCQEIGGSNILFLGFDFQVEAADLQTAYVAIDTSSKTLNYEVAF